MFLDKSGSYSPTEQAQNDIETTDDEQESTTLGTKLTKTLSPFFEIKETIK